PTAPRSLMFDLWNSCSAALKQAIDWFCLQMPENTFFRLEFNVYGLLALVLVSLICGSVGALVVGNRMAFFSDALAHCAFAGVALGFLLALAFGFSLAQIRAPEAHRFIT